MTALIICSSSASRIPCSPPRSTISRSSSAVIWASVVTSAPNRRVTARVIAVSSATTGPRRRPRKSSGPRQGEREPLGVGERERLGDELGEHDREQGEDDRHDEQRDDVRRARVHARRPTSSAREAVCEADGREGRGEEADEREAELDDGEEPARVARAGGGRAGRPGCPSSTSCSTRLRRIETSAISAATKNASRSVRTIRNRISTRSREVLDRGSIVLGRAVASGAARRGSRGCAPGRRPRACPAARPWVTTAPGAGPRRRRPA